MVELLDPSIFRAQATKKGKNDGSLQIFVHTRRHQLQKIQIKKLGNLLRYLETVPDAQINPEYIINALPDSSGKHGTVKNMGEIRKFLNLKLLSEPEKKAS
ncbi:MAG: hypothetical protein ACRCYZ_04680 [Alphaproteobacteria bacterium]